MVQDQLVNRIAASLLPSLSDREQRQFDLNVSRSAAAYEYFLRGNQLVWARGIDNARLARDLYRQCLVLDEGFAPAWAALGRVLRFIYKFGDENEVTLEAVDDAFRRAFALNPDLALAHNFYTLAQCDLGRAPDAMVRLLERARFRRHDADLFAGLVQACRYSGELHASVAAHERVRALDSHVATSVAHTYFLLGDYRKTLESYTRGASFYLDCAALASLGEEQEALTRLRERHATLSGATVVSPLIDSLAALLQGDYEGCIRIGAAEPLRCHRDPEVTYYQARHVARAGSPSLALEMLEAAIAQGFLCVAALESDPWLASVRSLAAFTGALQRAHELRREIRSRFESAGGAQVL
jgi:tetratricopeptide (TPR) repeat protein